MAGNGLKELEDTAAGLEELSSGSMSFKGSDVTGRECRELRDRGFAYVPSDRLFRGSSLASTIGENLLIADHHGFLNPLGGFHREESQKYVRERLTEFGVTAPPSVPIGTLSGGISRSAFWPGSWGPKGILSSSPSPPGGWMWLRRSTSTAEFWP